MQSTKVMVLSAASGGESEISHLISLMMMRLESMKQKRLDNIRMISVLQGERQRKCRQAQSGVNKLCVEGGS